MTTNNDTLEWKDLFGREIKVGDWIVYSAVDGRSGTLRAGQVIKLTIGSGRYSTKPKPKVSIKSWSNFRSEGWNGEELNGRQKNLTLSFLDRLAVVPEEYVSKKIKNDLAD
jgi:hypothetical protein